MLKLKLKKICLKENQSEKRSRNELIFDISGMYKRLITRCTEICSPLSRSCSTRPKLNIMLSRVVLPTKREKKNLLIFSFCRKDAHNYLAKTYCMSASIKIQNQLHKNIFLTKRIRTHADDYNMVKCACQLQQINFNQW